MACLTLDEVLAAADRDSIGAPPLTQEQADRIAAILAHRTAAKQPATSP